MKQSSKNILIVVALLTFMLIGYFVLHQPQPPDQAQIVSQIEALRLAGQARSVGGIMSLVSADYQDGNGFNPVSLRFFLNREARGEGPVQVATSIPTVTIHGDTAVSVTHVTVATQPDNQTVFDRDVTLYWKREEGKKYFVVPTPVWRIVKADGYGSFGGE